MGFLGKQFRGLNAIEKIAIVLSFFYGLGIVSLIQYNAFYTGGECLDFLRIKPILVGLQYFIYRSLPAFVLYVPMYVANRIKSIHLLLRIVVAFVFCLFLLMATSVMLHYFIPFLNIDAPSDEGSFWWRTTLRFWSMYFYWDFYHAIGMGLVFYISWMIVFRRHLFRRKYNVGLLVLCGIMNLFYFNKDMYVNIVQSAGGGAPRAGIITISNPPEIMKRQNQNYGVYNEEITKPCFILEENNDYFIIAEMFNNYPNRHFVSEADIRASATRIERNSVKRFCAINYALGFRNADSIKYQKNLVWDTIHHLDIILNLRFTPNKGSALTDWNIPFYGNVTNDITLSWWDADNGVMSCRTRCVNVGLSKVTNLLQQIKFSGARIPRGIHVQALQDTLKKNGNRLRIDHMPETPHGYRYMDAQLIFVCNFLYDIYLPWKGTLTDGRSLLLEGNDLSGGGSSSNRFSVINSQREETKETFSQHNKGEK